MNKIKKNALNAFAAILLLSSLTFAEGDMGGGGFAAPDEPVKVEQPQSVDGDMGGGGRTPMVEEQSYLNEVIVLITDYLDIVF